MSESRKNFPQQPTPAPADAENTNSKSHSDSGDSEASLQAEAVEGLKLEDLRLFQQVGELLNRRQATGAKASALSQNEIMAQLPELEEVLGGTSLNRRLHDIEDTVSERLKRRGAKDDSAPPSAQRGSAPGTPPGLFVWIERQGIQSLTRFGQVVLQLAKDVLRQLEGSARRSSRLRIAASEAFTAYLYPAIVRDSLDAHGDVPAPPSPSFFRPEMIDKDGDLDLGKLDLAIAWDAYGAVHSKDESDQTMRVVATPLEQTRKPPVIIFHPLHKFGAWARMHEGAKGPDFHKKMQAELVKHTILYPKALRGLASALEQIHASDSCVRVESFPTVVTHVAMRVGVGLFPGWGWLLEQLKREFHIYHLPIPLDGFEMKLVCYESRDWRNPQSAEFIEVLRAKLAALEERPPDSECWQPTKWAAVDQVMFRKKLQFEWDAYYINSGVGPLPYPHWRKGKWTFDQEALSPDKDAKKQVKTTSRNGAPGRQPASQDEEAKRTWSGLFEMRAARKDRGNRLFRLQAEFGRDYLRVMSTPMNEDLLEDDPRPAFLCFQEAFTRPSAADHGTSKDVLLLGFITRSRPGRPTVAPFILCPRGTKLEARDFRQIENTVECHDQGDLGNLEGAPRS